MFKVNDYVIYRKDVCLIKDIKQKNGINYYILIPIDDDSLKIELPTTSDNLRKPISKEDVSRLIERIPEICLIDCNDKMIENEYKMLLSTGNKEDLIKIIKTTYLRNKERLDNRKKISDKDNNYFNKAEKILYNELSVALEMTYDETKKYIMDNVNKMEK